MLGEILEIKDNYLIVKNNNINQDIINLYVKIVDSKKQFIGEITSSANFIVGAVVICCVVEVSTFCSYD